LPVMFFSSPDLRAPLTDRPETLPHGWNLAEFYNPTPKIWGGAWDPPKNWGQKYAKFGRFLQHPTLIANILGRDQHMENRKKNSFNHNHFHVWRKKLGELWSTNNRDPVVHIDPPKWIFREIIIRPLRGAAPSNFYTC